VQFEDGAQSHKLIKVPVAELAQYDATHDAVGRSLGDANSEHSDGGLRKRTAKGEHGTTSAAAVDPEK